jgi:hypothetical protein
MNSGNKNILGVMVSIPRDEDDMTREQFNAWFEKEFIAGFKEYSLKHFGQLPPDYAIPVIKETAWHGWSARPTVINVNDLEPTANSAIKAMGQEIEDLKEENKKLRHTIDNVLS